MTGDAVRAHLGAWTSVLEVPTSYPAAAVAEHGWSQEVLVQREREPEDLIACWTLLDKDCGRLATSPAPRGWALTCY
jgi:hypothetical protein